MMAFFLVLASAKLDVGEGMAALAMGVGVRVGVGARSGVV